MEGKSLVVKDKNDRFLREIRKAVPKLRVYNEIHSLSNEYRDISQPIIYTGKYDPLLSQIKYCTFILK